MRTIQYKGVTYTKTSTTNTTRMVTSKVTLPKGYEVFESGASTSFSWLAEDDVTAVELHVYPNELSQSTYSVSVSAGQLVTPLFFKNKTRVPELKDVLTKAVKAVEKILKDHSKAASK